ncbi:MAG: hypothetical protein M1831_001534 [Alyxoria varia]|nr:MAG: hypothetical protein M1831_001534 [Alyxoria varia]
MSLLSKRTSIPVPTTPPARPSTTINAANTAADTMTKVSIAKPKTAHITHANGPYNHSNRPFSSAQATHTRATSTSSGVNGGWISASTLAADSATSGIKLDAVASCSKTLKKRSSMASITVSEGRHPPGDRHYHLKTSSTTSLPLPNSPKTRGSMISLLDTLPETSSSSRSPSARGSHHDSGSPPAADSHRGSITRSPPTSPACSSVYSSRSAASSRSRLPTPTFASKRPVSTVEGVAAGLRADMLQEELEDVDLKTPPRSSFSEVAEKAISGRISKVAGTGKAATSGAVVKKPELGKAPVVGQESRLGAVKRMFSMSRKKVGPTSANANATPLPPGLGKSVGGSRGSQLAKIHPVAPANLNLQTPQKPKSTPTVPAHPKATVSSTASPKDPSQLTHRARLSLHNAFAAARTAERKSRTATHKVGLPAPAVMVTYPIRHGLMKSRQKLMKYGQLAAVSASARPEAGKIGALDRHGVSEELVKHRLKKAQCTPLLGYSLTLPAKSTADAGAGGNSEKRDPKAMAPSGRPASLLDLEGLRESRERAMVDLFRFCEGWASAASTEERAADRNTLDPACSDKFTTLALLNRLCAFLQSDGMYFVAARQVLRKSAETQDAPVLRDDVWSERFAARRQMVDVLEGVLLGGKVTTWSGVFTAFEVLFAKDVKILGGLLGLFGAR